MTETIRFNRIGKQDLRIGNGTFEVVLADGRVVTLSEIDIAYLISDAYAKANLPAAGISGRLARVTDDVRGLWMDQGSQWFSLSGEVVNVKEFGAKGDGVTDDTMAIQTAINAIPSTGGIVFFPKGIYIITAAIKIKDDLVLLGSGQASEIKIANGANIDILVNANYPSAGGGNRAKILNLKLNGNKANNTQNGSLVLYGVNDGVIAFCNIEGGDGTIPLLRNSSNWFIGYNRINNAGTDGITVYDGSNNNVIIGNVVTSSSGHGILVQGLEVNGQAFSFGNVIIGNQVLNNTLNGIYLFNGVKETKVIGNTSNNNGSRGIDVYSETTANLTTTTHRNSNIVIIGNTCKNNAVDEGIKVWDNGTAGLGALDVYIEGNRCFDDQGTPTQGYGIVIQNQADYVMIVNNNVRGNATGSIVSGGSGTNIEIRNNIGYNPVGISTITVGASPFTYTAGASPETIYIYGGTVSDVSIGGSTIATASPTQVELPPNQSVTVTYSAAPTMKKYVH